MTRIKYVDAPSKDLEMHCIDVGDLIYQQYISIFAQVPDKPTPKNPPLAFFSCYSNFATRALFDGCAEVEMYLDDKDFDYQEKKYTDKVQGDNSHNENFLVTFDGSALLKMVKSKKVQINLCTTQFALTQRQQWLLRWISENLMDVLQKNMGGAKSAKLNTVLSPVGRFKKIKKDEDLSVVCQYLVTGSYGCETADVTYKDDNGNTAQESGVSLPWTYDLLIPPDKMKGFFFYVSAQNQNDHGTITTEIKKQGVTTLGPTISSGGYVIATTSGNIK
jgi:hypothetical protein